MNKKVFMPSSKTKIYSIINICMFVLLFFSLAQATSTDNELYLYTTIAVIGLVFVWILIFTLLLKTKITINRRSIYCYGYLWSEGFHIKEDEKVLFRTILFEEVEMIEKIKLPNNNSTTSVRAIHIKQKNGDEFCVPLDQYKEEVVEQIWIAIHDAFPIKKE